MKNLKYALSIGFIFVSHLICLKRSRSCCCTFLMILGLISGLTSSASAVDFIAGAKGGYFIWDPYLQRIGSDQFKNMKKGTGVLYGPGFSASFTPDLSLSISGLFGQQSANWLSEDFGETSEPRTGNYSFVVTRTDIDSALSYRITDNFKLFGGYKYQYLKIYEKAVVYKRESNEIETRVEKSKIIMPYNGPAIGIGFSTPVGEKFFFASNFSLLYMWGKMDMSTNDYEYTSEDPILTRHPTGQDLKGIKLQTRGINLEPSFGASMGEGLPVFTLGLRFQWTQVNFVDPPQGMEIKKDWANDFLYGVFVTILYPF